MTDVSDVGDDFEILSLKEGISPVIAGMHPIMRARGPLLTGPSTTAMTAGDQWRVSSSIPVQGDIAWVLVRAEPVHVYTGTPSPVVSFYGTIDTGGGELAPLFGPAGNSTAAGTVGATYTRITLPYFGTQTAPSCWVPLERPDTATTGTCRLYVTAGTTPPGVDDWQIDAKGIVLLGYPAQLWDTSELWSATQLRGS